jgi:hypothetical protein
MGKWLPVNAISISLKMVSCCTVTCTLPSLPPCQYTVGRAGGGVYLHGVHGGVAGDCATGLMAALVKLDGDGRLSIMGHLEHAMLKMTPNRVHCVGVSPRWSWRRHHVVDWHSGGARARVACARQGRNKEGCTARRLVASGQGPPSSRRKTPDGRSEAGELVGGARAVGGEGLGCRRRRQKARR